MTRFQVNKCNLNINQYIPVLLEGTTNVLFAIAILVVGLFIANKA
jgi:small conductance mechanosensitive channel